MAIDTGIAPPTIYQKLIYIMAIQQWLHKFSEPFTVVQAALKPL